MVPKHTHEASTAADQGPSPSQQRFARYARVAALWQVIVFLAIALAALLAALVGPSVETFVAVLVLGCCAFVPWALWRKQGNEP